MIRVNGCASKSVKCKKKIFIKFKLWTRFFSAGSRQYIYNSYRNQSKNNKKKKIRNKIRKRVACTRTQHGTHRRTHTERDSHIIIIVIMRHTGAHSVRVTTFSVLFRAIHVRRPPYVQFIIIIISVASHALVCFWFDSAESVSHTNVCVPVPEPVYNNVWSAATAMTAATAAATATKTRIHIIIMRAADECWVLTKKTNRRKTRRETKNIWNFKWNKKKKTKQQIDWVDLFGTVCIA